VERVPERRGDPEPRPGPKRRRILDSALELFAEQGFDAARMDEVARRARVSKGTVYNHFDSKEALLVECVLHSTQEAHERIEGVMRGRERPDQGLASGLRALIQDLLPSLLGGAQSLTYQVWSLVARDPEARERLFSHYRRAHVEREQRMRVELEAGAKSGCFRADLEPDDVALVLLAIFDGLVYRAMFDPERVEPESVLDTVLRLLEGGLRRAGPALDRTGGVASA
jgi:AcrR family transcriptional regulator